MRLYHTHSAPQQPPVVNQHGYPTATAPVPARLAASEEEVREAIQNEARSHQATHCRLQTSWRQVRSLTALAAGVLQVGAREAQEGDPRPQDAAPA